MVDLLLYNIIIIMHDSVMKIYEYKHKEKVHCIVDQVLYIVLRSDVNTFLISHFQKSTGYRYQYRNW
jgi:ribonuclease BN (tRNA processing enzyme)